MHFERVGILVNINMFDSLLHRNAKLQYEPVRWHVVEGAQRHDHGSSSSARACKFHNGDPMTAEDVKILRSSG